MADGLTFRGSLEVMKRTSLVTIPLQLSHPAQPRPPKVVCVVATLVAFLMGVCVGISFPIMLSHSPKGPSESHEFSETTPESSRLYAEETPQTLAPQVHINASLSHPKIEEESAFGKREQDLSSNHALLFDGIYWGSAVENALPSGFSDQEVDEWRQFTRKHAVIKLKEGCGRMQNRLVTFQNGTKSCCRYRQNFDQIQGEIFSFFLSRLLGIKNVPPSALGLVKAKSWQWSGVDNQLALAQWAEERPVVLTRYVEGLGPAYIPDALKLSSRRLHPIDVEASDISDLVNLSELAQWSDLIVFDYLTANLDRVVNNLYNMQWNPTMMEAPAHNLAKHQETGHLVFLDNESGLLHGYRLLDKYESFHSSLLQALCIFRRQTADTIRKLSKHGDAGKRLTTMFVEQEPELQDFLPSIPEKSIKVLNERLRTVANQISMCEKLYEES